MATSGIFNVNKPEGKTSFDIVTLIRRLTREKHVGHAGTLDPMATGVLPICFGQGTRVIRFIMSSSKTYLAQIELGTATDTFDREGKITQRSDVGHINANQIEKALAAFRGIIEQVPPTYSAIKYNGKRCYDLARAGTPIKLNPRQVEIFSLEIISYQLPVLTIKVACGKGTYIRSLAHDLGQYLGCYAHLKNLTRLQYGPFHIDNALSISEIEKSFQQNTWTELFHSIDSPLSDLKSVIVSKDNESAIRNGRSLSLTKDEPFLEEYCRAYNLDGHLIAVLHFIPDQKLWHPKIVFHCTSFLE